MLSRTIIGLENKDKVRNYLVKLIVLFFIYFITAKICLGINPVNTFATLVWAPTGISLAALLLYGLELWPGILIGAFMVNFITGAPLPSALGIGIGNTLEAILGFYLIKNFIDTSYQFDNVKSVVKFILFACFMSTLISATIGVSSLYFIGIITPSSYIPTWSAWGR